MMGSTRASLGGREEVIVKQVERSVSRLLLALALLTAGAGAFAQATQTSFENGVLVEVSLQDPSVTLPQGRLVWDMSLETHAGDLRPLRLAERARLHAPDGTALPARFEEVVISESAHHPAGQLVLLVDGAELSTLLGQAGAAGPIELRLTFQGLGGEGERGFAWELPASVLAAAEAAPGTALRAYVSNAADGTISVIDLSTFEEVARWRVGDEASHGLALQPDGLTLYVGTGAEGAILALDTHDGSVTRRIEGDNNAHGIDNTADGRYVFVGAGGTGDTAHLTRIDTRSGAVDELSEGLSPVGHIDVSPDGRRLYVANLGTDTLTVLDTESLEVLAVVPVGDAPNESRASLDGRYVFVANWGSSDLTILDAGTLRALRTLKVGEGTHGVAVTPDGREVWVANRLSNDVAIIDAATFETLGRLEAGEYANHLTFTPDGALALVSNARAKELMVFDAATRALLATIPVGAEPHEIAVGAPPTQADR